MRYSQSFILACSIMLLFTVNNCKFLKSNQEQDSKKMDIPVLSQLSLTIDKKDKGFIAGLEELELNLGKEVDKLKQRQEEEQCKINIQQEQANQGAINNIHGDINSQNLLQFDSNSAFDDFGKFLKLKVGPPTIANSISTSESVVKSKADDKSVANTVQNVKSTTNADAAGEKNAIAVSNVVGTNDANTASVASDNSKTTTAVDKNVTGTSTANSSENSLAVSSVKAEQKADTVTAAANDSNAVSAVNMTTNAESNAKATEGSIADNKAISDEKATTVTAAANNSTSVGVTVVNANPISTAEASNQSLAQSVAESKNEGKTVTAANDSSATVGVTNINSNSNSTAIATDGGNALSIGESKSCVDTTSVANNASASVVVNNGGSNSNATSVSNGTAAPYVNPIETQKPTTDSNQTNQPDGSSPMVLTTTPLQSTSPVPSISDETPCKIPAISLENAKFTATPSRSQDIVDRVMDEKSKCGTLEENKDIILKAATSASKKVDEEKTIPEEKSICDLKINTDFPKAENICDSGAIKKLTESSTDVEKENEAKKIREEHEEQKRKDEEYERKKDEEERENLRAEKRRLKEENRRLREEQEDRERAARKAEERRIRQEQKEQERRRWKEEKKKLADRQIDYQECDMRAPRVEIDKDLAVPQKVCGYDEKEFNKKIQKDFDDGIRESNVQNDERFSDAKMFADNIREFDSRQNDAKIVKDCQDICKKENLGIFVESDVQDILPGRFLFKCKCSNGITDWYMYDGKKDKVHNIACTSNLLSNDDDDDSCVAQPTTDANSTPNLQQTPTKPAASSTDADSKPDSSDDSDEEDEDDGAKGEKKMPSDLGDCFNFFIENKFNKLHKRMNKLKARNTNYISNIHKQRMQKQAAGKASEVVDRAADRMAKYNIGSRCDSDSSNAGDSFKGIQSNVCNMKDQINVKPCIKDSPEELYFKNRNAKDENRFNQRLENRFESKRKNEDSRFADRFDNLNRYSSRDQDGKTEESCPSRPKVSVNPVKTADSNVYIKDEVGRIREQNKNYLNRINSMFGGSCTKIDSE